MTAALARRLAGLVAAAAVSSALLQRADAASPVADAAMAKDTATVRQLLKGGADVNAAQGDGMTALHWAAIHGDAALAEMLLVAGANVRATTRIGGFTPLHLATQSGRGGGDRAAAEGRGAGQRPDLHRRDAADAGGGVRQRRHRARAGRRPAPSSTSPRRPTGSRR